MKILALLLVLLFAVPAMAKVEIFVPKKTPIPGDQVKVSMHDRGQFNKCEEMGIVHNSNFWGGMATKKGMIKRARKQVGKVGGTDILFKETTIRGGTQQSTAIIFYCK